jgi:glutaminyl-tRNA synthetase
VIPSKNFIEHIIDEDIKGGLQPNTLRFRFPPEPNGFLHIGHVKAICINFGLGETYNAPVNLRFDDTNPTTEEQLYVDAIMKDIQWLGFSWDKECYASDYFQTLYDWAIKLIQSNKAYVDSQSSEEIATQKGTPAHSGKDSPHRSRSIEENILLFTQMKEGKHAEGTHVLRYKGDMSSPNMLLRDPVMYRILFKTHHRTGDDWCIYPMYDWTHGQSDYIEQVTHSLCSLEFKPHRELYESFLADVFSGGMPPKQREFARMNLNYTVTSKRKLMQLVQKNIVHGWDDPRMPTISGLRRRGYTASALKNFIKTIGVAKRDNLIDVSLLEFCIREDLNKIAPRIMAVLNPLRVIITNYPDNKTEWLTAENNPEDPVAGTREIPFSKTLLIEHEDFREEANRKFFRLKLGKEVRLKNAYIIKAESVDKDENGLPTTVYCTYDQLSKSGSGTAESQRKVKGTLHWVSAPHAKKVVVRNYDRLFYDPHPDGHKEQEFTEFINPESFNEKSALIEPNAGELTTGTNFQFQRQGYYVVDKDSTSDKVVFNKTVGLRDTWTKKDT